MNIQTMSLHDWLAYRDDQIADIEKTGKKLTPTTGCKVCDPTNNYVCFDCESFFIDSNQGATA